MVQVLLQMLFFMTPIIYPLTAIPEKYRSILQLNPLCWVVEQTRLLFIYGEQPNYLFCLVLFVVSVMIFQIGLFWFMNTKKGFADVL
ncbi:hypothetical protein SDC9_188476 [bioreactor metagenome]|uniref:ABC transmembrane type-2 domain-containing protein n=1 Tax=bioreactor metagenome TaxID=1076179 RepID=A0A645HQU8_9ZZZZ